MAVLAIGNNAIGSSILDLETFTELVSGDVLVSPTGNIFVFDVTIDEFESSGHDTEENPEEREFHFLDIGGTRRRITFDGEGISEYGIVLGCFGKVTETTGVEKRVGKEYDQEFNDFVDIETGWKDPE